MQLIENKRPTPFLIAGISAIRNFTLHSRPQSKGRRPVILSAAKPACLLSAAPRAAAFAGAPFGRLGARRTRPRPAGWTLAASPQGGISQIANRQASKKLENPLTLLYSITSKFLIDKFQRLLPTFRSHSSTIIRQHAISLGAPSFAAFAKGGVFPIANRQATR